jgi:hypothetical protein
MFIECLKLASLLDKQGLYHQADKIDKIVNRFPDDFGIALSRKQEKHRKKHSKQHKNEDSKSYEAAKNPGSVIDGYVASIGDSGDSGDSGGDGGGGA